MFDGQVVPHDHAIPESSDVWVYKYEYEPRTAWLGGPACRMGFATIYLRVFDYISMRKMSRQQRSAIMLI